MKKELSLPHNLIRNGDFIFLDHWDCWYKVKTVYLTNRYFVDVCSLDNRNLHTDRWPLPNLVSVDSVFYFTRDETLKTLILIGMANILSSKKIMHHDKFIELTT